MKRAIVKAVAGLMTCGLLFSVSTGAVAQSTDAVKKELVATASKMIAAMKKKDVKAAMSYYTDDYQSKRKSGPSITKAQMEQQMSAQIAMIDIKDGKYSVNKLTVKGNEAVAEVTMTITLSVKDQQGTAHSIVSTSNSRATFLKKGSDWKMKLSEELPGGKTLMDGKEMPQPGAGGGAPKKP